MKKIIALILTVILFIMPMQSMAYSESEFKNKANELAILIAKCEKKNINIEYEKINYHTLKKFISYLSEDSSYYSDEIMTYNESALNALYEEAKTNMEGYLDGTRTPKDSTYIYKTGDLNVVGNSIKNDDGRPIYSIGVGHGTYARSDLENLPKYGMNNVQLEIGVSSVIEKSTDDDSFYKINKDGVNSLKLALGRADAANVAVTVLLSCHYFPEFLYDRFFDLKSAKSNYGFNLHHPIARRVLKDFVETVMSEIKDYKSLATICIANEPLSVCGDPAYYNKYFREYLKELYGTVEALNSCYGSSYASFEAVTIPTTNRGAIAYDWMNCHDDLYVEYLTFLTDIIKEYTDIPTHAKIFREMYTEEADEYRWDLFRGISPEKIKSVSGMAGTDEESYYRNGTTGMKSTMRWYDILGSIYGMPVYNSEDHVIGNGDNRYAAYQNTHVKGYLWQAAMHGLSMSTIWIWERSYTNNQFMHSILFRPDVVAGVGKTNYDLNRLAYEVNAFNEKKSDVAIFYSDITRLYETATDSNRTQAKAHMAAGWQYYQGAIYAGEKVGFITDYAYDKLKDYKVLIIPQVMNITSGALAEIKKFIENGGKVIIYEYRSFFQTSWNSLKNNEYNKANNSDVVNYILNNSYKTSTYSGLSKVTNELKGKFDEYLGRKVSVVNADTGENVNLVDWRVTEYNGKTLVNLCNYNQSDLSNVTIKINGNQIIGATDLISGKKIGSSFGLEEMVPMLLEIRTAEQDALMPSEIINPKYADGVLKWEKQQGDSAYAGANIYKISPTGREVLKANAGRYEYCVGKISEPALFIIKAVNAAGEEADGVMCAIGMNKCSLDVIETKKNEVTGGYTVTVENNNNCSVYKEIIALIKDKDGKIVSGAGFKAILNRFEKQSFAFDGRETNGDYTLEIIQR